MQTNQHVPFYCMLAVEEGVFDDCKNEYNYSSYSLLCLPTHKQIQTFPDDQLLNHINNMFSMILFSTLLTYVSFNINLNYLHEFVISANQCISYYCV